MDDEALNTELRNLLSEMKRQSRLLEIKQEAYREIARQQNIALRIGRLKIDAAKAALDAKIGNGPE